MIPIDSPGKKKNKFTNLFIVDFFLTIINVHYFK